MPKLNILIVGASIAGPTCAYFLARAGCRVTVIERFPSLRTGGQNVDIRTTGVSVMRKIPGMESLVRSKTSTLTGLSLVRADGRSYGTIHSSGDPDRQTLLSEYEIFRGDLAKILYDFSAKQEAVEYVFNEQISTIEQQGEDATKPLKVTFANGRQTEAYDLVIACDGATSRTRALGLSCGVRDHIQPTNCWTAYFTIHDDLLKGSTVGQGFGMPGKFMTIEPDPARNTRVMLTSVHPRPAKAGSPTSAGDIALREFRDASQKGEEALKAYVASQFSASLWIHTPTILAALDSCAPSGTSTETSTHRASEFYASETVQVHAPTLQRARFALVGDAGYAPGFTGTGTTLALTGAYILAGELSTSLLHHKRSTSTVSGSIADIDKARIITTALQRYEERMKPIIKEMQWTPPGVLGVMAPQSAVGVWLKNWIFAVLAWSRLAEVAQRLFLGSAGKLNEKDQVPEYEWER